MTNEQAKEMLVLLSEMLIEQRRGNDRLDSLERGQRITNERLSNIEYRLENIEHDTGAIKRIVFNHEQRLKTLEHE
jgi:hypothetical protein